MDYSFLESSCGEKIEGPGIADNKGGVFLLLKGLEIFLKLRPNPNVTLKIVCSPNEETGSIGFQQKFKKIGLASDLILGFEPSLSCGSIIHSRNGNRWYKVTIKGKAAHSGRAHKGHVNAAHDLCSKVVAFQNLNMTS